MTKQVPLRVVVVGPPLTASGGIGRVMSYALEALGNADLQIRVLDTRGLNSSPWLSVLPLLRSCATLVWLAVRGRVDVAHVNISSHGSALRKGVVVRVCHLARIPIVLHLHASSFPEFFAPLPQWAQRWVRSTFVRAARVIVLAQFWRRYATEVLGVPPDRVTVIPNATPGAAANISSRFAGETMHLVFVGRLGERKGLPELLSALSDPRLRDGAWRATIAGDGDVEGFRFRAAELGIADRVTFVGWIETLEVGQLLAQAHVLVLPSHAEGLPMSVLESFAAGVPVVCTPVGGLAEIISDGLNGLLVSPGDAGGLADAILRLLQDEPLRGRLAAAARATWRRDHSIDQYARRLVVEWGQAASRGTVTASGSGRMSAVGSR